MVHYGEPNNAVADEGDREYDEKALEALSICVVPASCQEAIQGCEGSKCEEGVEERSHPVRSEGLADLAVDEGRETRGKPATRARTAQ